MNNITENAKAVELSAKEFLQDVAERMKELGNVRNRTVSFIDGEKAKLTKKRQNAETELEKIRTEISQQRRQYTKSIQHQDETKIGEIEKRLLELENAEHALVLRVDAFSKISGCDNGQTEKAFSELYAIYDEVKFADEFRGRKKKIVDDLEKLEQLIHDTIEEIKTADYSYSNFIHNILSESVVHAYEQIYGEIKAPKHHLSYSDHDKSLIISATMKEKE